MRMACSTVWGSSSPALKLSAVCVQLLVYIVSVCLFEALIGKFSHHRSSGVLDTKTRPAQCISKCSLPCEGNLEPQTQGQLGLAACRWAVLVQCGCQQLEAEFSWSSQCTQEGGRYISFSPSFPGLISLGSMLSPVLPSFTTMAIGCFHLCSFYSTSFVPALSNKSWSVMLSVWENVMYS